MFLRLSKNAYVRTYGPYTYILDRLHDADRMFTNAEIFMRWITREFIEFETLVNHICGAYVGCDRDEIENDLREFLDPLIRDHLVLCGETIESALAQEQYFSYAMEDPKTNDKKSLMTKEEVEHTPHIVLGNYFTEHQIPMRLHIDITQACTERCVHCYMPKYDPVFLPYERICSVIDELREMGGMHITFSGGECMMHPDFTRILRYAHSKDLTVGILSNLTLCDDEKVSLLKEVEATVQVSLYSMDPNIHDSITCRKGSWQKTKAAIEKLHMENIPCFIACPTMRQNYQEYYKVVEYAKTMNMSVQVDFIIMGKTNCDVSNLPCRVDLKAAKTILEDLLYKAMPVDSEYFSLAKRGELPSREEWLDSPVCSAGLDSICLDAEGEYYPCPGFAGFKLGSCHTHSLRWIWTESPEMKRLRLIRGRDFKRCATCPDVNHCSICMCRNYNETGDVFKPAEYFCEVARLNHEILDRRLSEVDLA